MKNINSARIFPVILILAVANPGCKKTQSDPYVSSANVASETPYQQHYDIVWDKHAGTTKILARFQERDMGGTPIHLSSPAFILANNIPMSVLKDSVTYSWYDSSVTDVQVALTKNDGARLLNHFPLSQVDNFNFDPNLSVRFRKSDGITVRWAGAAPGNGESLSTYIVGTSLNDNTQSEPVSTLTRELTSLVENFSPESLSGFRKGPIRIYLVKIKNIRPQPDGTALGSGTMKLAIVHEAQLE